MSEGRFGSWSEVVACGVVLVALAIATQLAAGIAMIPLTIAIGGMITLLLRLSFGVWERTMNRRHGRRA